MGRLVRIRWVSVTPLRRGRLSAVMESVATSKETQCIAIERGFCCGTLGHAEKMKGTPWLSNRLTEAEIEALRQDQSEALAYAQKVFFPNAKIHRATDTDPEVSKDSNEPC